MPPPWIPSSDDRLKIQEMLNWWRLQPQTVRNRPRVIDPDHPAPDTYIALIPGGGIAALSTVGTAPPTISNAACEIYQQVGGVLVDAGFVVTVYNVSTTALTAGSYVPVTRDKFGTWVPAGSGGSGGGVQAETLKPLGGDFLMVGATDITSQYSKFKFDPGTISVSDLVYDADSIRAFLNLQFASVSGSFTGTATTVGPSAFLRFQPTASWGIFDSTDSHITGGETKVFSVLGGGELSLGAGMWLLWGSVGVSFSGTPYTPGTTVAASLEMAGGGHFIGIENDRELAYSNAGALSFGSGNITLGPILTYDFATNIIQLLITNNSNVTITITNMGLIALKVGRGSMNDL